MNAPTTTQNPKRYLALLPLAGIVPAIASPLIAAAGGKSLVLVFFGCWLFLMGLGCWIARKRLNAQLSPVIAILFYISGIAAAAIGIYIR